MKASEHFDLPVAIGSSEYLEEELLFCADGNGTWCATFCSKEQAMIAAKAINHADKLADALKDLIVACRHARTNILACAYAEEILEDYRGAK